MLAATFLVNGAAVGFGRLQARRLVELGLPSDPVLWFAGLGFLALLVGAAALRLVEPHVDDERGALRGYVAACGAGAVGVVTFAGAPEKLSGSAAALLVAGIALPLTRTMSTIWVNRQTSAVVRATVHSFLAQAEYLGEIVCGVAIAMVARRAGLAPALVAGGALFAIALLVVAGAFSRRSSCARR
jgi:hypothetical protein